MNYYQHHIGDFRSGTFHMTRLERWIYRDMIDIYYDKEQPLPLDFGLLLRTLGIKLEKEAKAVSDVLTLKFQKTEDGYHHIRCDDEIIAYHKKSTASQENGKKGGRPKKNQDDSENNLGKSDDNPEETQNNLTETQNNPEITQIKGNQEPETNNQEPETTQQSVRAVDLSIEMRKAGVTSQPADPRLIALAEQGITTDTVRSACEEAKVSTSGERIGVGLVVAILERWAKKAAQLNVKGATPPQKNGAWWASDDTVLAKGAELGLRPHPGEQMPQFKGRVQAAIDNAGKPPAPVQIPMQMMALVKEPIRLQIDPEIAAQRSAELKAALNSKLKENAA